MAAVFRKLVKTMTQFRLESFATLPRWKQTALIFFAAAVLGAIAGLLRNEIVSLLNTL